MQVNSRKETMDTQFFSPLLGAVPSPPTPLEPSRLCSDWPGCAEDFGSQTSFQECPKKRYQHSCCAFRASASLEFSLGILDGFFGGEFLVCLGARRIFFAP